RVLVTGSSSLLGRTVVASLEARGDTVVGFQRGPSATHQSIAGDLRDRSAVLKAASGQDAIIHAAALVAPKPSWSDAYAVNVDGTNNVIDAANGVGRLVHISTPSVAFAHEPCMGGDAEAPTYDGRDRYAHSKAIGERLVLDKSTGSTIILRPHLIWGPGDTQLVGRLLERAMSGRLALPDHGRALIGTTYIDDAAAAIVAALDRTGDSPQLSGKAFVVTGGEPRPVSELVHGILAAFGIERKISSLPAPLARLLGSVVERVWRGEEPPLTAFAAEQLSMAHWFDQRATESALLWEPRVSVDEGLQLLTAWASTELGQQFLNGLRHRNRI
ncbi:MAG: NAD-dependent epimerase/dehydratase family protein, partial [Actinomycetota bacterium]